MENKKIQFANWFKRTVRSAMISVRKLAGSAQEKIKLDSLFQKQAVKLKRISTSLLNLDGTILGIFDRKDSALTVRATERLEVGEMVESEHIQYRIEQIRSEGIQFPLSPEPNIHFMPCRVLELKEVGRPA